MVKRLKPLASRFALIFIACATVLGPVSAAVAQEQATQDTLFEEAIHTYFEALSSCEFRIAYEMRADFKITVTEADGHAWSFSPRPDYEQWQKTYEDLQSIRVLSIGPGTRTSGLHPAQDALGIRTFGVSLEVEWKTEVDYPRLDSTTYAIWLFKGTDGKVRILGIGF